LALTRQCELAGVNRSTVYAPHLAAKPDEQELALLVLIDVEYTRRPFYGSRKIKIYLRNLGYRINRKRVQRLMAMLGLAGMAPGPNTSRPHPQHKIYPYLLRGVVVTRPNQVWSTDITYIRLPRGFVYLAAVIDWYSRRVLSWRLSNTTDSGFCVDCLEEALQNYGTPEIFNTDQGSQFTSEAFTGVLLKKSIAISMDGRGRALDEYLRGATLAQRQARRCLPERLWYLAGIIAWTDGILCFLQHGKNAPIVGLRHAGSGLSYGQWWRSQNCGQVQHDSKNAFRNRSKKPGQRRPAA
jgi:putative transposase